MKAVHPTAIVSPHARIYTESLFIGEHSRIDDGVVLTGNIIIGAYVHIGAYSVLTGKEGITIGDYSGTSAFVSILTGSDDFSGKSMTNPTVPNEYKPGLKSAPVNIGRNVIIGSHSTIMPGVHLKDGCAVGAYSLVKRSCDADSLYGGVPAKKIRERSKEMWLLTKQFEAVR